MRTRAAVLWEQPGSWTVQEVDLDDPGPSEVLVEMAATGVCHSDDHWSTGDAGVQHLPIVAGHEGGGIVREVGALVTEFAVGDHVLTSFIPACGICRWCASGMQNLCENGAILPTTQQPAGGFRMHADGRDIGTATALGAFAEWQVYDRNSLVRIDPEVPLDVACLVACGVQTGVGSAVNAAEVRPGDVVLVIGIGGIGINAVQGARLAGATHVIAVDLVEGKRDHALAFGATEFFTDLDTAADFARSVTGFQGADSAILSVGVLRNDLIGRAYTAIRKGGTVVVTALGPDGDDTPVTGLTASGIALFQKRIQGALYGMASPREAMPKLLREYRAGRLKLDELITNRYRLDDIGEAFRALRAGENLRGIIEFPALAASRAG
jgi:NDMA-dependent alcohol dehydrogenase